MMGEAMTEQPGHGSCCKLQADAVGILCQDKDDEAETTRMTNMKEDRVGVLECSKKGAGVRP